MNSFRLNMVCATSFQTAWLFRTPSAGTRCSRGEPGDRPLEGVALAPIGRTAEGDPEQVIDPGGGRGVGPRHEARGPDVGLAVHERVVEQGQGLRGDVRHVAAALRHLAAGEVEGAEEPRRLPSGCS